MKCRSSKARGWGAAALACLLALAVLLPTALPAAAAPGDTPSLGVSPPTVSLGQIQPGEVTGFEITVFNAGQVPLKVDVGLLDFTKDANGTLTPLPPGQHPFFAMSAWVELQGESSFTLQGQEQRKEGFRVTVPSSIEPGERSMAVSFTTNSQVQGNVTVSNQVLTQVFALTGEKPVVSARADKLGMEKDGRFATTFQYDATIRDTGNTHLLLDDVKLLFYRGGKVVHEVSLPALLVLPAIPGQSPGYRIFNGDVSLPAAWASYDVRIEIPSLGVMSEFTRVSVFPLWWLLVMIGGGLLLYLALCVVLLIGQSKRYAHRRRRIAAVAHA